VDVCTYYNPGRIMNDQPEVVSREGVWMCAMLTRTCNHVRRGPGDLVSLS
jgi:hypothetical protein